MRSWSARAGIRVCLIRDWLGCLRESRDSFWDPLRAAGGEVRTFNPLRLTRPFGWLSRDHRKVVVVDSDVAFVSGLCVSARWLGDPARGATPESRCVALRFERSPPRSPTPGSSGRHPLARARGSPHPRDSASRRRITQSAAPATATAVEGKPARDPATTTSPAASAASA